MFRKKPKPEPAPAPFATPPAVSLLAEEQRRAIHGQITAALATLERQIGRLERMRTLGRMAAASLDASDDVTFVTQAVMLQRELAAIRAEMAAQSTAARSTAAPVLIPIPSPKEPLDD